MQELGEKRRALPDIDGTSVVLSKDDLLIETAQTEGYETQSDGKTTVVLIKL